MATKLESEGYKVIIYTNKDGYERFFKGNLEKYPLWLCSFTPISEDIQWTFWQYSHRGMIEGVNRMTDLNVFAGSRSDWDSIFSACRQ